MHYPRVNGLRADEAMLRDIRFLLKTHYSGSRALVIGIDDYTKAPPLSYAVSDADGAAEALVLHLGFPEANIVRLTNKEATKASILHAYLALTGDSVDADERVVVFYAGHGHTVSGYRGDIGYLVPWDADPGDLSTLIKWDELTGNSELVRAKHMLFIMDACYGGLALTRNAPAGSTRFLKDMLLRYSRQVLTAGKPDEVVADAGGPLPGHSVFTGHLIQGMEGAAATDGGVITATGLMSYVYGKVASDKNSRQTPHFGHFDGDGDMILLAPGLADLDSDDSKDLDMLIVLPAATEGPTEESRSIKTANVKRLLAGPSTSIELHDYVMSEVQALLSATSEDNFAHSGQFSDEEFLSRVARYEEAVADLSVMLACIGYWGQPDNRSVLRKSVVRTIEHYGVESGLQAWLVLRWYPAVIQLYSIGIAAMHGDRHDCLHSLMGAPVGASGRHSGQHPLAVVMSDAILELTRTGVFKRIPGYERHYAPMSEHLFKVLQPGLDDALFVGQDYERAFDEFEVLFALVNADISVQNGVSAWGNVGRFGWKQQHGLGPLSRMVDRVHTEAESSPILQAGIFGGTVERFDAAALPYLDSINKMGWR